MKDMVKLSYSARSDVGRSRPHNEDGVAAYHFTSLTNSRHITFGVFAVSDGMGGHNAGEIASMTAIKSLMSSINRDYFQAMLAKNLYELPDHVFNYHFRKGRRRKETRLDPAQILKRAIQKANTDIIELSRKNPAFFGMGATLTAAILENRMLTLVSVGDSRCYLVQNNTLKQLTRDHTIVSQMLELGTITAEEAEHHPGKNFLYRSLGADEVMDIDLHQEELSPPSWLLICSDGLNNMVSDRAILELLSRSREPHAVTDKLIRLANRAGGKDNISAVLVKVT